MKAVRKLAPGYDQMDLRNVEEPEVSGTLIKIQPAYTGICGSDIHTFKGEYKNPETPVTLGHEFSGTVVEIGPEVTEFKVGDRVVSETTFETCGECRYCLRGDYNLCSNRKGIGTQQDGSYSEYLVSREESVHLIPDNVSFQAAALSEPLACCTHAVMERTEVGSDETVLVIGPGPIGLLLAQVVKAQGAKVIISGISKDQPRLDLALELGVDIAVDSLTENLEEIILEETDGYGVDHVFDCSGSAQAVNQALPLTAKTGTFVQVGLFSQDLNEIDQDSIIQREIHYIGSRSQKPSSWEPALRLLAEGSIDADKMITKIFDLDQWRKGFEAVMSGEEIKVLVESN